jgi:multisubunit Na+/H+ antiporter MnhB subunit
MIELYIILSFMILGAIIAVETKDLLSAVISVSAVGFGNAIAFLFLKAPDIAIVQVIVEILVLVLLIRAVITRRDETLETPSGGFVVVSALMLFGVFIILAIYAFRDLPKFGQPLMKVAGEYTSQGLSLTKAANLVTSVLLDFRAYDTLGEATVIFTAVLGALAVLRRIGRKRDEGTGDDSHSEDDN